jgi:hypothetical protein
MQCWPIHKVPFDKNQKKMEYRVFDKCNGAPGCTGAGATRSHVYWRYCKCCLKSFSPSPSGYPIGGYLRCLNTCAVMVYRCVPDCVLTGVLGGVVFSRKQTSSVAHAILTDSIGSCVCVTSHDWSHSSSFVRSFIRSD